MTRSASEIIDSYLAQLRMQLEVAGAVDIDDQLAEIRSYLTEAAEGDADAALAEVERLGDAGELARGMLVEARHDAGAGLPTGTWWRMGIAAPIDVLIGLSVPVASVVPLLALARSGEPRWVAVVLAVALGAAVLAWPFFVWRPWQQGGMALSPGMTIAGVAVVRTPGFWQVVRVEDLGTMGLAPRRRISAAVILVVFALVLMVSVLMLGFGALAFWGFG